MSVDDPAKKRQLPFGPLLFFLWLLLSLYWQQRLHFVKFCMLIFRSFFEAMEVLVNMFFNNSSFLGSFFFFIFCQCILFLCGENMKDKMFRSKGDPCENFCLKYYMKSVLC